MPHRGFTGSSGNQSLNVRKLALSDRIAGTALTSRKVAIATMMTRTVAPEAVLSARNTLSGPNRLRPGSAPPPPSGVRERRGDGGGVGAGSAETAAAVSAEPAYGD